jgi:putative membrane protein
MPDPTPPNQPTPLRTAEFDPKVKTYFMASTILVCIITIVGIPLLLIAIPLGHLLIQKYLDNLSCVLTTRTLEIKKGVISKSESTIPLDKITDLQLYQGPLMRALGLQGFKVETAGQSATPGGSLVNIVGIKDCRDFREAVLAQRDAREERRNTSAPATTPSPQPTDDQTKILHDIHHTLKRIEQKLTHRID